MSCVLRISGADLDLDKLLPSIQLDLDDSYKKGEPRIKTLANGKKNKKSGVSFLVSNADFEEFDKQKRDAISFLTTNLDKIKKIMNWSGVDEGTLDFGITHRDVVVQCDYLPPELLQLAGSLGIGIEISQYPEGP